jgi:DNA-binding GntR family transcriptional regulator
VDSVSLTKPKTKAASPAASSEADAAKDILAAVKAGDASALSLALKRHYEACYEDEDEEEA